MMHLWIRSIAINTEAERDIYLYIYKYICIHIYIDIHIYIRRHTCTTLLTEVTSVDGHSKGGRSLTHKGFEIRGVQIDDTPVVEEPGGYSSVTPQGLTIRGHAYL